MGSGSPVGVGAVGIEPLGSPHQRPSEQGRSDARLSMSSVRQLNDATMGAFARLLVRIFFRLIELEGTDNLASAVPTVLVANHQNGLVDGHLLMATLPRYPRFLGKSTLFRILPLWPFPKLAGVVPVYRAKDGGSRSRNTATFRTCQQILAPGPGGALSRRHPPRRARAPTPKKGRRADRCRSAWSMTPRLASGPVRSSGSALPYR